jgi:MHS family alpha-ketoglutarate permease-like MFS transporter
MATENLRGFYSSFQYVTLVGGQLVALGIQLLLQFFILTDEQLHEWGWRIPFAIGAVLSIVAFYIRSNLDETQAFLTVNEALQKKRSKLKELLEHPKAILTVVGLTAGGTLAFYTYTTYMQKYLVNSVGLSKEQSTLLSFLSLLFFAMIQPLFGFLSDKVGRKPLLIGFGVLGTLLTTPLLSGMANTSDPWIIFAMMIVALVIVSGYTSINAVVKAELFPASVRALGVGLPYALTVAIFGGSAEYIALWLKKAGHESYFSYYISAAIFVSLLVYVFMKDTRYTNKME